MRQPWKHDVAWLDPILFLMNNFNETEFEEDNMTKPKMVSEEVICQHHIQVSKP